MGLPYLGYYPFLSEDGYLEQLHQITKKCGKVFCFTVTGQLYAHVSNQTLIREILITKSHCFERRPANFTLNQELFEGGIFFSKRDQNKVLRKFFIQKFKEFGFGSKPEDGFIQDNLPKIISSLSGSGGNPLDALNFFSGLASDVMRRLLFGDVTLDMEDIQQLNETYVKAIEFVERKSVLLAGPIVKYILMPFVPGYRNFRKHNEQMRAILKKFVKQHKKEFDRNNLRNLVDAYINERKLMEEKKDPRAKAFTEHCLTATLLQFYGDGFLGVGWFTSAILHSLASCPDVQKAIQSEIDEVIGLNRLPSLDDKSRLIYTIAAIYEGLRMNKIAPLQVSLECIEETIVEGCRIPKGTITALNIWAALNDPEVYDEPDKFDPTRFLSSDRKKLTDELPSFFGSGKRSCLAEPLAMMQVLLFIATVFQHFNLHPVEEYQNKTKEWKILIKATPRAI